MNVENNQGELGERCFVYVATGSSYCNEAVHSAYSLKEHHPDIPICIICDAALSDPVFDLVLEHPDPAGTFVDKLAMHIVPYEKVVFIDSDTLILDSIADLFTLLDKFDIAATQETLRGWDYKLDGIPDCFPEFTTGLIAFRRTPEVIDFFAAWQAAYQDLKDNFIHAYRTFDEDQPSFRKALFWSDLRLTVIPSEYQFVINYPNYLMWKARLLHGRGDLAALAGEINRTPGARVFFPDLGVYGAYRGRLQALKDLVRFVWRSCALIASGGQPGCRSAHRSDPE